MTENVVFESIYLLYLFISFVDVGDILLPSSGLSIISCLLSILSMFIFLNLSEVGSSLCSVKYSLNYFVSISEDTTFGC